jgi:hypothetical protein
MLIVSTFIGHPMPTTTPGFRTVFSRSRLPHPPFSETAPVLPGNHVSVRQPRSLTGHALSFTRRSSLITLLSSFTQNSALGTQDFSWGRFFPSFAAASPTLGNKQPKLPPKIDLFHSFSADATTSRIGDDTPPFRHKHGKLWQSCSPGGRIFLPQPKTPSGNSQRGLGF